MHSVVLDKSSILNFLSEHREELSAFGVSRIGLFGSYVRDAQGVDSDVDVLVQYRKGAKTLKNLVGLADFLEGLFDKRVDLVTEESLSPFFGHHILKEVEYAALAG
jgi:predicted nucleotidyltransferase